MTISETAQKCTEILDEVEQVIVGKREVLRLVLLGILAGGHVLLEDLPGLGKTMMARSFARVRGLQFSRIQFTPDLLPADVSGASACCLTCAFAPADRRGRLCLRSRIPAHRR